MASWAARRRMQYIGAIALFFLVIIVVPTFLALYKPATCNDGKQNGGEAGVDCGGRCLNVCGIPLQDPITQWSRALKISTGLYNVVAMIENPNLDVGARNTQYVFKVYDKNNVLITERYGMSEIPPDRTFPVFEAEIRTGTRIPARTFFEFIDTPQWIEGYVFDRSEDIVVVSRRLTEEDTTPQLDVVLENISRDDIRGIIAHALLFDADGNTVAASRTTLDRLIERSAQNVSFTWPEPFGVAIAKVEITVMTSM